MRKYLELLYFGAYFWEWRFSRFIGKILDPLCRYILMYISKLFPKVKKNLQKRRITPEKNADYIIRLGSRLDDVNVGKMFEMNIGVSFSIFYCFVLTDIILILRFIFGKDWGFILLDRVHSGPVIWFVVILSFILSEGMIYYIGNDATIKRYRLCAKKVGRKAFYIYIGSFIGVILLCFILFKMSYI